MPSADGGQSEKLNRSSIEVPRMALPLEGNCFPFSRPCFPKRVKTRFGLILTLLHSSAAQIVLRGSLEDLNCPYPPIHSILASIEELGLFVANIRFVVVLLQCHCVELFICSPNRIHSVRNACCWLALDISLSFPFRHPSFFSIPVGMCKTACFRFSLYA